MNWAHLHLILNLLTVLGPAFVLIPWIWSGHTRDEKALRLAQWPVVGVPFIAIPGDLCGEPADVGLETLLGELGSRTETTMEAHESFALRSLCILGPSAACAAASLSRIETKAFKYYFSIALANSSGAGLPQE